MKLIGTVNGKINTRGGLSSARFKIVTYALGLLCIMVLTYLSPVNVMAQDSDTDGQQHQTFEVTNLVVEPDEATVGRAVTIKANMTNTDQDEGTYTVNLDINGKVATSQNVTLAGGASQIVEFKYTPSGEGTYTITIGNKSVMLDVVLSTTEAKFREGPVVRLRPVTDKIDVSKDGLVELFFSNPSLNDITLQGDIYVSVPSGIHVYGEGFGLAGAAGTVYGQFTAPPGTARTIYLNIKADETAVGKTYFIHFSGQYWPDGDKDAYNPISLTHPFEVLKASPNPEDSRPTNPNQIPGSESGGIWWTGWGVWIILAVVVLGGIGIIVAMRSRKTEVSIEK